MKAPLAPHRGLEARVLPERGTTTKIYTRARTVLLMSMLAATFLTACTTVGDGPGGETTCGEWIAMTPPILSLNNPYSEEKEAIVKRMLDAHDKDTGFENMAIVELQIAKFCLMADDSQPLDNAVDWS